jgi:hypothetical protein
MAIGKWSLGLIVGMVVFYFLSRLLAPLGQTGGDSFFSNLALAIPRLLAGISGIAAFFIGIIDIIKFKERSVIVFITTAIGLFILFFVSGEFLFPH